MAKGQKTGGRAKGTPNKITASKADEVAASGITPLDYMLEVLRDVGEENDRRQWAAQTAAPYVHPKLATIDHGNKDDKPFGVTILASDAGL